MAGKPYNPHEWFTAGEAAEIASACGIAGLPATRWGMTKLIRRDSEAHESGRRRAGQKGGGGKEYHWAMLPESLWSALRGEIDRREQAGGRIVAAASAVVHWQRRPTVDLSAPSGIAATTLADAAGLRHVPVFRPYEILVVNRCRVSLGGISYFSVALEGHHKEEVCVTASPDVPHLVWICTFDRPRQRRGKLWLHGAGSFIGLADDRDGKTRYVPLDVEREAVAARAEAEARRAAVHRLGSQPHDD